MDDICFEILKKCKWDSIEDIESEEINYIEKYNSEWLGFNGVLAKTFKYQNSLKFGTGNPKKIYEDLKKEITRQTNRAVESFEKEIEPLPHIWFNYMFPKDLLKNIKS